MLRLFLWRCSVKQWSVRDRGVFRSEGGPYSMGIEESFYFFALMQKSNKKDQGFGKMAKNRGVSPAQKRLARKRWEDCEACWAQTNFLCLRPTFGVSQTEPAPDFLYAIFPRPDPLWREDEQKCITGIGLRVTGESEILKVNSYCEGERPTVLDQ